MAKIKVQNDLGVDLPSEQGYVNIVDNLLLNPSGIYQDFIDAEPDERPQFLTDAAGMDNTVTPPKRVLVTHLVVKPDGTDGVVEITPVNCRIFGEKDKRKKPKFKTSRFTIPIPDKQPADLDYLQPYAEIIHNLYKKAENPALPPAQQTELRRRAHKFMFGVMMLTRCR